MKTDTMTARRPIAPGPLTLASALASALAILALAACAPKSPPAKVPAASAAARTATVVFVEGQVSIDGAAAEPGKELPTKFVVSTGPGARLDIVFDGRNALNFWQNTVASVDLSAIVAAVRLDKGGIGSVLKNLSKLADKDSFELTTSHSVAGVRGTSFCVWADEASTYVCACNGAVRTIDAKGGNELLLEAAHHAARIYAPKEGKIVVSEAGMLHHTDEGIQSLASRIGYTIDWTKIDR
ncbi:MAG: FecR domain-containing protein [Spirochaetaceae bacterium]|nr:FecR domain-containing protein [Spirochaetaceae bacterium]